MGEVKALGRTIHAARRKTRITMQDLAGLAGISARTVRAIECGTGTPSVGAVAAIANAVGLNVKAL